MNKIDLTYGGKLQTRVNVIDEKNLDINFTIDGETGKATTTSILIDGDKDNFLMITFDYQELKEITESKEATEELHICPGGRGSGKTFAQTKEFVKQQEQEIKQLKQRIEKAIEYIKTHSQMTDLRINGIENVLSFRGSLKELLAILQGDDKNDIR